MPDMTIAESHSSLGQAVSARKPLRVLMVCNRYLPELGGVETHIREVSRRLSTSDHIEVTVLATDRSRELPRAEIVEGICVLRVPSWPPKRDYYLAPQLGSVVAQPDRWDLIHCQGIHSPVPVMAMRAARRAGIPYVVTFHTGGHSGRLRNALRSTQWRLIGPLLRGAAARIAVSRFEAETLSHQARLGDKPVIVIRNGGTLPLPRPDARAIPGRMVSSGRLEWYKGHHRMIEALPHVMHEVPEAHLVILGSGPCETALRQRAVECGVKERVTIRHIPPDDREGMATALAEASVIGALSDYEAHPVGVMEALSVGRPVVGYRSSGIADLVAEGWVHGVTPGAPSPTIADHLVRAMSSSPLVEPATLPTWDSCSDHLSEVYAAAVSRR